MISKVNSVLVHAQTEHELYVGACKAVTSQEGFPLAWVGIPLGDGNQSVEVFACAGNAVAYLDGIEVSWGDNVLGHGPTGQAIRSGQVQFNNNMLSSPQYAPWVERASRFNLQSSFSLPIKLSTGQVVAAFMVYSVMPDAFGKEELSLLDRLSADLGYGVESLRTRVAYQRALVETQQQEQQIVRLLEDSIEVLAYTLEIRDPYTAGHEKRVADLSVAIAAAMGLDKNRVQGLRLAAMVHDIGKIQVPAEILVKPGKLSQYEYKLIQEHPTVGYNILSQVDYPWPVAQAVWQHHERLDGSGYPRGLNGDEIILEARIISVADIVEAMSSHRPYRPALGMASALEEIQRLSPRQLDENVVNVCLELFQSNKYSLKQ
ncbi:cyclic di-GMP phosphodiesterase response regulator RpfG [mine drainage metagenome]|uniref:Cyclic di-GMP phosphodiesterase response regulator RpfG n=1 Tax=mine drainage metagenome TaxID=410659 RepID=A0A1J5PNP3_9ZZZZ